MEASKNRSKLFAQTASSLLQPAEQQSPFAMPSDTQIFRMKERERERKKEEKESNQKLKIWEKGVKKQSLTIKELNELGKKKENEETSEAKQSLIEAAKIAMKNRVKINEPMYEFISKKRETLLFQMLIDHKREKINEFEEMTRLHSTGLEKAEHMLLEDTEFFNAFLNENKREARDAIKNAEDQTRKKNQKVAIIKEKLEIQADLTGKNMSKRETLQNLKKYKNFLESLSPELNDQERRKRQERVEKEEQQAFAGALALNDDISDSSDEEEMYFKEPEQLMSIFHSLEESNLFLITNLKEIEQEIEEAKAEFNTKKDLLSTKKQELLMGKAEILRQIATTEEEIDALRKTNNKDDISNHLSQLQSQIQRLSRQIGYGAVGPDQKHMTTALEQLKELERRIETQLRFLQEAKDQKPAVIHNLEKMCFNDKREKKKIKNEQELQEKAIKQKIETSPEREKRIGRPIMMRSIIKKQVKQQEIQVVVPQEQIDRKKYLM